MNALEQYLQDADHAYADLIAERGDEMARQDRRKALQQARVRAALLELIPEPLHPYTEISFKTMMVSIVPGAGLDGSYVQADFRAEDWTVEIVSPWSVYVLPPNAPVYAPAFCQEEELMHAIGALRHELSKQDEEVSAA